MLLAYTDGISEAMTASEEEWGEKRMIKTAQAAASCSADEVIERIFAGADAFTKGAPQHDDMTLLVMKVESFLPTIKKAAEGANTSFGA